MRVQVQDAHRRNRNQSNSTPENAECWQNYYTIPCLRLSTVIRRKNYSGWQSN